VRMPEEAEALLSEGTQDFVSLGRAFLADAEWVAKAMEGRDEEIRRCISCLRCIESLQQNAQIGQCLECAVNPRTGRELETAAPRVNGDGRVVAVAGAGPAGLAAAEVLAERGFKAVLFEREASAGGQVRLAAVPPKKHKIAWCIEDLEAAALRRGAEIAYDSPLSIDELELLDARDVIVATGALPLVPDIPGVGLEHVCTVNDVLDGTVRLEGKRVAVIGAGMTGLETAEKLAEDGNRIMVIEMADELGPGVYFQNLDDVLDRLLEHHPELITSQKLVEIRPGEITLEHVRTCVRVERQVDNVVLAIGVRSDDRLADELKSYLGRVLIVGDSRCPGRIFNAVRDGFDTAWNL